ncbi:Glucanosyltransferase-domain-containing protein [Aspergillus bertholletiae]|uniref:1,3-beta-glucanosyltransferase n=1 Tax=Aspergillus bertholletiae TaxID=1226010 RepID=A0A5N7AT04_9EURO|nr:Glucanosyltransferase-domain-containing protein [Aspergillus bertholletiae]
MRLSVFLLGAVLGTALADVPAIIAKGSKFFYSNNGTQFFIRGIAYQQEHNGAGDTKYTDPLVDPSACERDIPYFTKLRTNVIRTYAVDPSKNHDECMKKLADAGIYLISDLSSPTESIERENPRWHLDLYKRYTDVIDAFAKYDNVIGFFTGNEVANTNNNTAAMAFVRAAIRDMKAYIKQKKYRDSLAIGYSTDDDQSIRAEVSDYLVCGDKDSQIDMFGYNIYEWCGKSSFRESGYEERTKEFSKYPVPAFFSEYGCNNPRPRPFDDVPVLYSDQMNDVWSGGIVYMYFQEDNNYGLVTLDKSKISTMSDFNSLSSQIQKATATGVKSAEYRPTASARTCPKVGDDWKANAKDLPPTPNADLCGCMDEGLTCVVKDSVSEQEYGKLFGMICGNAGVCDGLARDAIKGKFGAYSMCSARQQLSFVLNQYYQQQSKENQASACDFGGAASTKNASKTTGSCSSLLSQAGSAGTSTVSFKPTSSGGSGSGSSTSDSAAGLMAASRSVRIGSGQIGAYLVTAMVAGAGMILL